MVPDLGGAAGAGAADSIAGAAAGAAASNKRSYTGWGALWSLLTARVPLFGGEDNTPAMLSWLPTMITEVAGWHIALDSVIESLAVLTPAAIGLGLWGAAAYPIFRADATQLENIHTVVTATGQSIYPLQAGMSALTKAAQPAALNVYGDALSLMGSKSSALTTVISDVGSAISELSARATLAMKSSAGGTLFGEIATDLSQVGDDFANTFGIIGNLLKSVPGIAGDLLHVSTDVTGALESFTGSGVTQGILRVGLAFHGIVLWGGLAATVFSKVATGGLGVISNLAFKGAAGLEGLGSAGKLASDGLLGVATTAEAGAALPWGWIAAGAAAIGFFAYEALTAKDATETWLSSLQTAIGKQSAGSGLTGITSDQILVTQQLAQAQHVLAVNTTEANTAQVNVHTGLATATGDYQEQAQRVTELTAGQVQLNAESALYSQRLDGLARTFGGAAEAQGLLAASGITMGQFLSKNKNTWAQVQEDVLATSLAYKAAGQAGGRLGADMAVLTAESNPQLVAMEKLDSAWQTFIGLSTGLVTSETGVVSGLRSIDTEAKKSGASFTGVNTASLNLQNTMAQQITSVQSVIGSMSDAQAPVSALAAVFSTDLAPAVHRGALQNAAFKSEIEALAASAGYTGSGSISSLTNWIDKNATSLGRAMHLADEYAAALSKIPATVKTSVNIYAQVSGNAAALALAEGGFRGLRVAGAGIPGYASGTRSAPAGLALVGEAGPEVVDFRGGEAVYPAMNGYGGLEAALSGGGAGYARALGGDGERTMTVVNNFNGAGTQSLQSQVRAAISAASVAESRRLRIGRRS